MWPMIAYLSIGAVQADAVFASGLQPCGEYSAGRVRQAVAAAIEAYSRSGCAGRVAQEFGDHPETAMIRMRWARAVAREAFAESVPELDPVEVLTRDHAPLGLSYMQRFALPADKAALSDAAT